MQAQVTPLDGSKAIGITFTDKPVTAFGRLALFVAFVERIGLGPKLTEVPPFVLTSPNATPPHHIVLAFVDGVLVDTRRFAQLAVLQADVAALDATQSVLLDVRRADERATGYIPGSVHIPPDEIDSRLNLSGFIPRGLPRGSSLNCRATTSLWCIAKAASVPILPTGLSRSTGSGCAT